MTWLKIDKLAAKQGLTYRQLSKKSGISEGHLRRLRKQDIRWIRLKTLAKLCKALDVEHIDELIDADRIAQEAKA